MRREVAIEDLQRKYTSGDMVKADCGGCHGCSECCHGMGESVVLDPLDVQRLVRALQMTAAQLLEQYLELHVVDGIVLPNLRMSGPQEACLFLNAEGRCGIHGDRPGICRLFPLGRIYEDGGFSYFLQRSECPKEPKTKIRVSRWIDTPQLKSYESYVLAWHTLLEKVRALTQAQADERLTQEMNMYVLNTFFLEPYGDGDFYTAFEERRAKVEKLMKVLA